MSTIMDKELRHNYYLAMIACGIIIAMSFVLWSIVMASLDDETIHKTIIFDDTD